MSYYIYLNAIHYVLLYTIAGGFCSTLFIVERTHLNAHLIYLDSYSVEYYLINHEDDTCEGPDAQETCKEHPEFLY